MRYRTVYARVALLCGQSFCLALPCNSHESQMCAGVSSEPKLYTDVEHYTRGLAYRQRNTMNKGAQARLSMNT